MAGTANAPVAAMLARNHLRSIRRSGSGLPSSCGFFVTATSISGKRQLGVFADNL
jgi:hypothetical protein